MAAIDVPREDPTHPASVAHRKHARPALVVVMGTSGCGKSTCGKQLSIRLGAPFVDGDSLHPRENIDKMSRGIPLTDEDRTPWLDIVRKTASSVATHEALDHDTYLSPTHRPVILIACSALKRSYRDILRGEDAPEEHEGIQTYFLYLRAPVEVLKERLTMRLNHFMSPEMLESQVKTLEEPQPDEVKDTITLDLVVDDHEKNPAQIADEAEHAILALVGLPIAFAAHPAPSSAGTPRCQTPRGDLHRPPAQSPLRTVDTCMPGLPPIASLVGSPSEDSLLEALSLLLEPSNPLKTHLVPDLCARLSSQQPSATVKNFGDLLDLAADIVNDWSNTDKASFVASHPRIGQSSGLSKLSATEQQASQHVPQSLSMRLEHLNQVYEKRYPTLRYVTFVNKRSKAQVADEMESRLGGVNDVESVEVGGKEWSEELDRALRDILMRNPSNPPSSATLMDAPSSTPRSLKRKAAPDASPSQRERPLAPTPQPHQEIRLLHVDPVIFGQYEIRPWFSSPYILHDPGLPASSSTHGTTTSPQAGTTATNLTCSKVVRRTVPDVTSTQGDNGKTNRSESNVVDTTSQVNGRPLHQRSTRASQAWSLRSQSHVPIECVLGEGSNSPALSSVASTAPLDVCQSEEEEESVDDALLVGGQPSSQHDKTTSPLALEPSPRRRERKKTNASSSMLNVVRREGVKNGKTSRSRGTSPAGVLSSQVPIKLFVCDGCFKYVTSSTLYLSHKKRCTFTKPPGQKVYSRGSHTIWELDGSNSSCKLYCQNLCLFGKLFIEHKYIFFDVSSFWFYILTETTTTNWDGVLGFFSREKTSHDNYNLACIVTFPPFQKRSYGSLLIEFSYELDRIEKIRYVELQQQREEWLRGEEMSESPEVIIPSLNQRHWVAGTPERPLSGPGARGYLSYWTGVLIRYFRHVLSPNVDKRPLPPTTTRSKSQQHLDDNDDNTSVTMSLLDIANDTLLRPDDVAFTLVCSGLVNFDTTVNGDIDSIEQVDHVVVSLQQVEEVAKRIGVKRALLDPSCLCL